MASSPLSMAGKTAIVTGSSRETNIGAAIAFALARQGASVAIHHVSESSAPRAKRVAIEVETLGGRATVVQGNITDAESVKKIVEDTLTAFETKNLDILVNNAGGPIHAGDSTLTEMNSNHILETFTLNYLGPILMILAAVPHMPQGGRIINIGAMASLIHVPFQPAYGASKAALDHSTRYLAAEASPKSLGKTRGITVNTVAPGGVLTDPLLNAPPQALESIKKMSTSLSKAADRMGTTEDIADVVLFVASEKCRWITGNVFPTGGGMF